MRRSRTFQQTRQLLRWQLQWLTQCAAAEEGTLRRRGHAWFLFLAVLAVAGVPLTSSAAAAPAQDPFDEICSKWSAVYRPAPGPTSKGLKQGQPSMCSI
jgi:hypothetical protein